MRIKNQMAENNKFAVRVPHIDLTKSTENGIEAIKGAQNLIRLFGKQVEPALYALLCDTQSETRLAVDKALKGGGQSTSAMLIPLLTSQFGIAPAIATMVAAVTVQAIATVGQEKLCKALAAAGANQPVVKVSPVRAAPEPESVAEVRPRAKPRTKSVKPVTKSQAATKPKPKPEPKTRVAIKKKISK